MEQEYGIEKAAYIKEKIRKNTKKSMSKYIKNYTYTCCNCLKTFSSKRKTINSKYIFCCRSCYYQFIVSHHYVNGFKIGHKDYNTPETRKKNSLRMKIKWRDDKKYSSKMKNFFLNNPEKHPLRKFIEKRKKQGLSQGFISSQQEKVYVILKKEFSNIEFELEYPIKQSKSNRHYYLDIAVPKYKIDIEYDGQRWHLNKDKDAKRDDELRRKGWVIFRVNHYNFKEEISNIIKYINLNEVYKNERRG